MNTPNIFEDFSGISGDWINVNGFYVLDDFELCSPNVRTWTGTFSERHPFVNEAENSDLSIPGFLGFTDEPEDDEDEVTEDDLIFDPSDEDEDDETFLSKYWESKIANSTWIGKNDLDERLCRDEHNRLCCVTCGAPLGAGGLIKAVPVDNTKRLLCRACAPAVVPLNGGEMVEFEDGHHEIFSRTADNNGDVLDEDWIRVPSDGDISDDECNDTLVKEICSSIQPDLAITNEDDFVRQIRDGIQTVSTNNRFAIASFNQKITPDNMDQAELIMQDFLGDVPDDIVIELSDQLDCADNELEYRIRV